ncbi:MAG: hypothetical protein LBE36_11970 [Flavobacteriaceae bacterium]|jgi:hypothetical protein|nr:hypothetical protein [Flavobacteriaceae bacterium]
MKDRVNILLNLAVFFTLFSCTNTNAQKTNHNLENFKENTIDFKLDTNSNDVLKEWFAYYQSQEDKFSLDNFIFNEENTINEIRGNICGIFDDCFDNRFVDFLVYSPDKKRYIDFDSYSIILDENNVADFEIDQEINVVDIEKKTITRIVFYGSSQWVEDAFWENDSTIILLENSPEQILSIEIYDLNTKRMKKYKYKKSLDFTSDYSIQRLNKKGIKVES